MTPLAYFLIFTLMGCLMASVLYGLYWAIQRGQFKNFQKGATCIFDEDEPIGYRTDAFPDETKKA